VIAMNDGTFERFAALPEQMRRTLLARLLADPVAGPRLEPSYAQRRTWFLRQLAPTSPSLNLTEAYRLRGPLRLDVLDAAVAEISARHEPLRARFVDAGGRPVQLVSSVPVGLAIERPDLSGHADLDAHVRALVEAEADRPFDLQVGPLMRARVVVLGPDDHLLLVNMHHIVSDGWSLGVFFAELADAYRSLAAGGPSGLLPLPYGYADYVARQRELTTGEALQSELAWWRGVLAGVPDVLELPTDRPRPVRQRMGAAVQSEPIPAQMYAAVRALAATLSATPFMVLMAAYALLLHRFADAPDLLIGTAVTGRRDRDDVLIGLFTNTIVLPSSIGDDPSFAALVQRIRRFLLDARDHENLPHDLLVGQLNPARDAGRNPLFQVFFSLEDNPAVLATLGGATAQRLDIDERIAARFDASLSIVRESGGALRAKLGYDPDLFEAATMTQLVRCYLRVLGVVTVAPRTLCTEVDLVGADPGAASVTVAAPAPAADPLDAYPTLHTRIAAQAAITPDRLALSAGTSRLTYAELEAGADRLAARLRECGVRPGDIVGICPRRGLRMVCAMLAVLKCGAAYVPLDPAHPTDRLAFMLTDTAAAAVLADGRHRDKVRGYSGPVIDLDPDLDEPGGSAFSPVEGTGADLAYVLYTSGSTGAPKAVAIEHRAVLNLIRGTARLFGRTHTHLASSSISFDSSISEIFQPLTTGGCAVIVEHLLDLAQADTEPAVTIVETVPSLLRELLRQAPLPPSVTTVSLGGEPLHADLVTQIFNRSSVRELFNMYGPTEATVSATWTRVSEGCANPTIGAPLPGVRTYVLDRRGWPVPVGFRGQLYLGGAGIARGYVNRAALTAQRFLADPYAGEPGARLYATGDLARQRADGELVWLGRSDRQVKVRGQRIELGEVEQALLSLESVQAAVVCAVPEGGDLALCAYVCPPEAADLVGLRAGLRELLPAYMVPTMAVGLDAVPLNSSGKVDLAALPEPHRVELVPSRPPATPAERAIADIWSQVLGAADVGSHDDFFALGGHSLLAIQVLYQIERRLGARLDIPTIFDTPTVAGLAELVDDQLRDGATPSAEPDRIPLRRERRGSIRLAPNQRGLVLAQELAPDEPVYSMPTMLWLRGPLDVAALRRAVHDLSARHEALRIRFTAVDGEPQQYVSDEPIDLAEFTSTGAAAATTAAAASGRRPFRMYGAALARIELYRATAHEHLLLVNLHHAVADGWSLHLLLQQLADSYRSQLGGHGEPVLDASPPLQPRIGYLDWVAWQALHRDDAWRGAELGEWREALVGAPTDIALPADRRDAASPFSGVGASWQLQAELTQRLRDFARAAQSTVSTVLLAALAMVLYRCCGQREILVGVPVAGRAHPDTHDVIGLFINTVTVRADLAGRPTFHALLSRLRQRVMHAYAHDELAHELVVAHVNPPRRGVRNPLFQVLYAYETDELAGPDFDPVTAEPAEVPTTEAKVDVTLAVRDSLTSAISAELVLSARFLPQTARRLAGLLDNGLAAALANPDVAIEELNLSELSRPQPPQPDTAPHPLAAMAPSQTIPALFAEHVRAGGDRVAVVGADGRSLTFAQLDALVTRVARALGERGVGPDRVVGVQIDRSLELIIALVAVLRTGGAYLPLETDLPSARREFMLDDAVPCLVVSEPDIRAWLEELAWPGAEPAEDEAEPSRGDAEPDADRAGPGPADLAYVIYTSGSTGVPKGVEVSHGAIANRLLWMREHFGIGPGDRILQKTPIGFDVSVWELFVPLISGATLVLAAPDGHRDPSYLAEVILRERITAIHFVPSMLREFVSDTWTGPLSTLRTVICSGEELTVDLQTECRRRIDAPLFNLYGPTEAAVDVSYWSCVDDPGAAAVPIGHPVWNTELLVLDDAERRVPPGVIGELYLAGAQLARGYRNQPELTRQRFVRLPDGRRAYRTGDLASTRDDGAVLYHGRTDDQVKVRGVRIELAEVEAALRECPGVAGAAVAVRNGPGGIPCIVGYLVRQQATAGSGGDGDRAGDGLIADDAELIAAVRAGARARLPDSMAPTVLAVVAALPLTRNGKLDRAALPDPAVLSGSTAPESVMRGRPPRTPTEELVAGIFADVLQRERMLPDDDFFAAGGHSLLAMRLAARVETVLGAQISVRDVFAAPTPALLAGRLMVGPSDPFETVLPLRLGRSSGHPPLFCVHPAAGIGWCYATLLRHLPPEWPVYALQDPSLNGHGDVVGPAGFDVPGVTELAAAHIDRVRAIALAGPYHLAGWSFGGLVAHEMACQLRAAGDEVGLLAILDAEPGGDGGWTPGDPVRDMLDALGYEVPPEALDHAAILAALERAGHALASLTPVQLDALGAAYARNLRRAYAFQPHVFDGAVTVFTTGGDPGWQPYVRGQLTVEHLPCLHREVLHPQPAARVGAVLASLLAAA
jgi:amino acid adenylation domain-containing protein